MSGNIHYRTKWFKIYIEIYSKKSLRIRHWNVSYNFPERAPVIVNHYSNLDVSIFSGPGRQRQTNKQGNCVEYLENKTTSEERG